MPCAGVGIGVGVEEFAGRAIGADLAPARVVLGAAALAGVVPAAGDLPTVAALVLTVVAG